MAVCSNVPAGITWIECSPQKIPTDSWLTPKWLQNQNSWFSDIITELINETGWEIKIIKEVLLVNEEDDKQDGLLPKSRLWRTSWIKSWVNRFITTYITLSKEITRKPITKIEINAKSFNLFTTYRTTLSHLWSSKIKNKP